MFSSQSVVISAPLKDTIPIQVLWFMSIYIVILLLGITECFGGVYHPGPLV